MTNLRTAAQQALEALEWHLERGAYGADIEGVTGNLRAALEQQTEPVEPVATLTTQRDALLEALKLAWPIIEKEKFMQDGCYGKNFIQSKAERARKAYEAARAAIKAVEEGK